MTSIESSYISSIFGCAITSFPQTYVGLWLCASCDAGILPFLEKKTYVGLLLSDSKLPRSAFLPFINLVDKCLSSFAMNFVSRRGRLTLTGSVISAFLAYLMPCINLLIWVIEEINKLQRPFVWKGKHKRAGVTALLLVSKFANRSERGGLVSRIWKFKINVC